MVIIFLLISIPWFLAVLSVWKIYMYITAHIDKFIVMLHFLDSPSSLSFFNVWWHDAIRC